jgi:serine/threonine protein kinase
MTPQLVKKCGGCGREFGVSAVFCPYDGQALIPIPNRNAARAGASVSGLHPGRVIDERYEIIDPIGYGGMGIVFRALHVELNRRVALKILNPDLVADPTALGRFRREARALGAISHPNAVSVMDFGVTDDGLAFLVMELLEGRTLRDIVTEAPLTQHRAARIMTQVCGAVAEAHRCGVIHRDLKPDNIMLVGPDGEAETAKVLDFGIAKLRSSSKISARLTAHDTVVGTPHYMAPEACEHGEFTPATDVYALAIILYEMLTGLAPFDGANALDVAVRQVNDAPPPLRTHRQDVSDAIEAVVMRSLSKAPTDRHASAVDLAEAFASAVRAAENRSAYTTVEIVRPAAPSIQPVADVPSVPTSIPASTGGLSIGVPRGIVLGLLVAGGIVGITLVLFIANALLTHPDAPPTRREFNIDLPQQPAPGSLFGSRNILRIATHLRSPAQLL